MKRHVALIKSRIKQHVLLKKTAGKVDETYRDYRCYDQLIFLIIFVKSNSNPPYVISYRKATILRLVGIVQVTCIHEYCEKSSNQRQPITQASCQDVRIAVLTILFTPQTYVAWIVCIMNHVDQAIIPGYTKFQRELGQKHAGLLSVCARIFQAVFHRQPSETCSNIGVKQEIHWILDWCK